MHHRREKRRVNHEERRRKGEREALCVAKEISIAAEKKARTIKWKPVRVPLRVHVRGMRQRQGSREKTEKRVLIYPKAGRLQEKRL